MQHLSLPSPGAVLAASLVGFLIGGLWYSPILFARRWLSAAGLDEATVAQAGKGRIFGLAFACNLFMALALAALGGVPAGLAAGLGAGLLAGLGLAAPALGVLYLFELRPLALWWINGGYLVATLAAMGALLGAWQ